MNNSAGGVSRSPLRERGEKKSLPGTEEEEAIRDQKMQFFRAKEHVTYSGYTGNLQNTLFSFHFLRSRVCRRSLWHCF